MHYIKGSLVTVPDSLSRTCLQNCKPEVNGTDLNYSVNSTMLNKLFY